MRCPEDVHKDVIANARASAASRKEAVRAKDERDIAKARDCLSRLFPRIPLDAAETVLHHGFQKGSGRVGRSTVLVNDDKVTLAVIAHARHTKTEYDTIIKKLDKGRKGGEKFRQQARALIRDELDAVLRSWRPLRAEGLDTSQKAATGRKQSFKVVRPKGVLNNAANRAVNSTTTRRAAALGLLEPELPRTMSNAYSLNRKRGQEDKEDPDLPRSKRVKNEIAIVKSRGRTDHLESIQGIKNSSNNRQSHGAIGPFRKGMRSRHKANPCNRAIPASDEDLSAVESMAPAPQALEIEAMAATQKDQKPKLEWLRVRPDFDLALEREKQEVSRHIEI